MGKTALVTGGTRGIGEAISQMLKAKGYDVAANYGGNDEAAKDVCMHIAAMRPLALNRDELDPEVVEKERSILRDAAIKEGKQENIAEKMVEGQLRKFFSEQVLLDQPFVKEPKVSVGEYAKQNEMEVNSYIHWVLGEA